MTPTKELFLKRTELRTHLLAVAKTDWFAEVLVYAFNETVHSQPSANRDFIDGAQAICDTLTTLGDEETPMPPNLSSGILHDFDRPKNQESSEDKKED